MSNPENPETSEAVTVDAIKTVLDGFVSRMYEERRQDPAYQKLFKTALNGQYAAFDAARRIMMSAALDCAQAMKEAGYKMDREAWDAIMAAPFVLSRLSNVIQDQEGLACSTDKARLILSLWLQEHAPSVKTSPEEKPQV